MPLETINCNFIGDFKVGDNLLANSFALCRLSELNEDGVFNKLIVVQAGSIVEVALDQIIYRAQNFTAEGVANIAADDLTRIRGTKIERFNNLIQSMERYNLLNDVRATIYADLHKLRELRNRIHIQFDDSPANVGRDDDVAFADDQVAWALALCIDVLKHLSQHYARPAALAQFAQEISIPTS